MPDHPEYDFPAPGAPPPGDAGTGAPGRPAAGPGWPAYPPAPPTPGGWAPPAPGAAPGPQAPSAHQPPPGMLGAAHKPGAVPLRPLGLGDMFDAAFRIIRFNPKATVGSAVLVASVAMLIPVLATAVLTLATDLVYDPLDQTASGGAGVVASYGSLGIGIALQYVGGLFVTGMVVHVAAAAAVGRPMTLGQAWAATRGNRWRLVGLSLLLIVATVALIAALVVVVTLLVQVAPSAGVAVLLGLLLGVGGLAALFWFWVRVYLLPVPALMLESLGVLGAVGRGFRLTSRQFWRIFGIALLTVIATAVASQILAFPVSLVGTVASLVVPTQYALLATILGSALAQVVATAFVAPFTAAVVSLQYLDQRIRKEAYDVDLMTQAGIIR